MYLPPQYFSDHNWYLSLTFTRTYFLTTIDALNFTTIYFHQKFWQNIFLTTAPQPLIILYHLNSNPGFGDLVALQQDNSLQKRPEYLNNHLRHHHHLHHYYICIVFHHCAQFIKRLLQVCGFRTVLHCVWSCRHCCGE